MPENQDPDDNQGDGSVGNKNVQQQREHIKDLERQLAEVKAQAEVGQTAAQEAAELKEQLAGFHKAAAFDRLNIPPTGAGKLFRDTYQGDVADEAIAAKAAEYGLIAQANPNTPTIPGVDVDAWSRQQASLSGTRPPTGPANAMEQLTALSEPGVAEGREKTIRLLQALGVAAPTQ